MYTIADVFYNFTCPDSRIVRCSDKDRLDAVLYSMGYTKDTVYTMDDVGRRSIIVSLSDNRNKVEHAAKLAVLCKQLQDLANSAGVPIKCFVDDCWPFTGYILVTEW